MPSLSFCGNLSGRCESAVGCREWGGPQYPGSPGRKGRSRATSHRPDISHDISYQGNSINYIYIVYRESPPEI